MTVQGSGVSSGQSYNTTASYNVVYHSATTYKVNVNVQSGSNALTYTIWVHNDGTVVAVEFTVSGYSQNLTGSQASGIAVGALAEFTLQIQADSQIAYYTNTGYFHTTGTSTVQLGPTSVHVTTYAANSLPTTITSCGSTTTLTAYSFSVGTPQGASQPLVTYENFAGSYTDAQGHSGSFNYVQQVTAITLA